MFTMTSPYPNISLVTFVLLAPMLSPLIGCIPFGPENEPRFWVLIPTKLSREFVVIRLRHNVAAGKSPTKKRGSYWIFLRRMNIKKIAAFSNVRSFTFVKPVVNVVHND